MKKMLNKILDKVAMVILVIIGILAGLGAGFFLWPVLSLTWAADRIGKKYSKRGLIREDWDFALFIGGLIVGIVLTGLWWILLGTTITPLVWDMIKHQPS